MSTNIRLYSTLTRKVENFTPLIEGVVSIYACGVTTYDDAHIGHARQAIFFDAVRNYFVFQGFSVNYVRNYTDIDDKIIVRAHLLNKDPLELSDSYVHKTAADFAALKISQATHEPKVTDHLKDIITLIEDLIKIDVAYIADGDVLFDITTFPTYGKLSGLNQSELINSDKSIYKRHPQDFVLWKKAKAGEPSWPSQWGDGRPGWHIECSALAKKYLGNHIDIHGGGIDLIFPHHENEIAQTESLTHDTFASYWLHNGLVMVDGKKMSKSFGNFITIKQILEIYQPDVVRFAILSVHFSSPLDFTPELFEIAEKRVYYFYRTLNAVRSFIDKNKSSGGINLLKDFSDSIVTDFESAMNDNLNTALAISNLSTHFVEINRFLADARVHIEDKTASLAYFIDQLSKVSNVLKIFDETPQNYLAETKRHLLEKSGITTDYVEEKIRERSLAKSTNDFVLSDSIREELQNKGIELHDRPDGTGWDFL